MAVLGSLVEQIRGVSYKPEDLHSDLNANSIMLLRANNIRDDMVNFDEVVYVDRKKVADKQLLRAGDILICTSSGSKELVGKAAYITEDIAATFGAFCKVVRPRSQCAKYIGHFFCSPIYRERIANVAGGANINNIRNEHIDELSIPLPALAEQESISALLDSVTTLISLRKQQIAKLDELVKARFVEMFGDVDTADYWSMSDLCSIITDGTHQPPKFVETGIPFLFVSNITGNVLTYDAEKFIDEQTYNELIKRTPIEIGDILLSTVGSYGHPAVVKEPTRFCFQRHIAYLKPRHDIIDCNYLHGAILSSIVQEQIEAKVKGIAQKTLNLSEIRTIKLPVPCMDEQHQYAAFVAQTDQQKLTIQQSLAQLELLKKALMQKYFG